MSGIWEFVKDPDNRAVLSWTGSGIAALAVGIWAVVKFLTTKSSHKPPKPSVSADRGSVAAGGDIKSSQINIDSRSPRAGSKR
jgi:hypothetical protein